MWIFEKDAKFNEKRKKSNRKYFANKVKKLQKMLRIKESCTKLMQFKNQPRKLMAVKFFGRKTFKVKNFRSETNFNALLI